MTSSEKQIHEKFLDKLIDYKNTYYNVQDFEFAACLRRLELELKDMDRWSEKYFLLQLRDAFFRYNRDYAWVERDLKLSKLV